MPDNSIPTDIADLQVGHHAGLFYGSEDEHRAVITEYLRQGLTKGEKVMYITDSHSHDYIKECLVDNNIDIQQSIITSQFVIIDADDAYMKNGSFDPHRVIDTLWDERGKAMSAGYPALRLTSEMSWALKNPSVYKNLVVYEEELNRFLPSKRGFGNCLFLSQYDMKKFPADFLMDLVITHPIIISGKELYENYYYQSPDIYFSPDRSKHALKNQLAFLREKQTNEKRLLKSHQQLANIYEYAPVGLQLYTRQGQLIAANRMTLELFGVNELKLMGHFNLFSHLAASNKVVERIGTIDTVKFETSIDFDRLGFLNIVNSRKTGVLYLDVTLTEVNQGIQGFQGCYLVCLQDISKRKREERKKSEDKFCSVVEVASDAIVSCDTEGHLISWNQGAAILFGYSANEILGKPILSMISERSRKDIEDQLNLKKRSSNNNSKYFEAYGLRRGNLDFPIEVSISNWQSGTIDFFTIIIRDVSQKKNEECQLKTKESALASSINPIAIVDFDGTMSYVNVAFLHTWGYDDEKEVIGRPATSFWDSPSQSVRTIQAETGKGWIGELVASKYDGTRFLVQLSSSLIKDTSNQLSFMVASFVVLPSDKTQITEPDQEIPISDLDHPTERDIYSRIDFTTAMAHEIKTRLTPILSSSDMLATELKQEPFGELARAINRGTLILDERVNSMLDIALSAAGNLCIDLVECSIVTIISDVTRNMIPVASYYRQSLLVNVPEDLPIIFADSKRLKQVLTSFLETATKVTPEGGIIRIFAKKKLSNLQIEVTDTSPGLTEEQKNFLQISKGSVAGRESLIGLGFGLSLAKSIIDLHNGDMWMSSEKGKGNIFGFSIPIKG